MTDIDSKESAEWKEPTIESLRQQLADSDTYQDSLFQQKMALKQQLAECQASCKLSFEQICLKDKQLAESQAREKVLREEFKFFHAVIDGTDPTRFQRSLGRADRALALPHDSTALDSAIKQAKREALLEAAEHFYNSSWIEMDGKKRISKDFLVKELRRMAEEMK
jgi:hypothetical protein